MGQETSKSLMQVKLVWEKLRSMIQKYRLFNSYHEPFKQLFDSPYEPNNKIITSQMSEKPHLDQKGYSLTANTSQREAQMKSFLCRPLIEWLHHVTVTLPHSNKIEG